MTGRTIYNTALVDGQKLDNLPLNTIDELAGKVDKVSGKELSDEKYTITEKNKLAGI